MQAATDVRCLRRCIELAEEAVREGNHPFGAVLVGDDGVVLGEGKNTHSVDGGPGHAEANLARAVAREHSPSFLQRTTLYTSVEPCCMCAGTIYWAGIGTVVFGMTEQALAQLTGDGNAENPTLSLDCRQVFAASGRDDMIEVRGPFPELEKEIKEQHARFWK